MVVGRHPSVVLLIGGVASGLGVGVATLLMGIVVAVLVVSDELKQDVRGRRDRGT